MLLIEKTLLWRINKMKKTIILLAALLLLINMVSATGNFKVELKNRAIGFTTEHEGVGGEPVYAAVDVTNLDSLVSTKRVECGIYPKAQVESWYASPLPLATVWAFQANVPNCVEGEPNVQTKSLTLEGGEVANAQFLVFAPERDPGVEYVWHCQAYDACWSEGVDIAMSGFDVAEFDLLPGGDVEVPPVIVDPPTTDPVIDPVTTEPLDPTMTCKEAYGETYIEVLKQGVAGCCLDLDQDNACDKDLDDDSISGFKAGYIIVGLGIGVAIGASLFGALGAGLGAVIGVLIGVIIGAII